MCRSLAMGVLLGSGYVVEAVNLARRRFRYVSLAHIVAHALAAAPARVAKTAAAAGLDAHPVAGLELDRVLQRGPGAAVGGFDHHIAGLGVEPAMQAPGRALGALEARRHAARRQHEVAAREAQPAAKFSGAARIRAQPEALDHEGIARFVHLDRDHPGVAVAHGAERSGPVLAAQRAPATETAVVALPQRPAVGTAARAGERREGPVMAGRHP